MTAATWAGVHVGDTVRGADQRPWTVIGREELGSWVTGGAVARFTLRLGEGDGAREVATERRLDDGAELCSRAEHDDKARAFGALIAGGLAPRLLEETVSTTPDPFAAPAASLEPKHDRFGRYLLPDPVTGEERAWTRATTIARTIADEYNLTQWKLRQVAKGMGLRPDLVAGAAAADPDEDKGTLNSLAQQAMDAAESKSGANFGTALHSFAHRLGRGESLASLRAPEPLAADLAAYLDCLKAQALRIEHSERIVVLPALGIAGTLDQIVTQPPGATKAAKRAVLDLKTAKSVEYSWLEIAIQLAIYAHATHMWDPATRTYVPMPSDVDQCRALVLHLPVGKASAQLYGVPIDEGWRLTKLALDVREARGKAKRKGFAWLVNPDPIALAVHNVSRATSQAELAALWERLNKQGHWTEEVNDAAHARLAELTQQPQSIAA